MRKSRLIKHLDHFDTDELKEEILRLYEHCDQVKEYYRMELGSEEERQKLYRKIKDDIGKKFVSRGLRRTRPPRIAKVRRILRDIEKRTIFPHELIDVYLFVSEQCTEFAKVHYFRSEPLFNLLTDVFTKAKELIDEYDLQATYDQRLEYLSEHSPIHLE